MEVYRDSKMLTEWINMISLGRWKNREYVRYFLAYDSSSKLMKEETRSAERMGARRTGGSVAK